MKPFGRSLAGSKPGGAEFVAMMGSGVGVVFELMLGRDAELCPADSSTGQAGRASGLQVHDSQVAPLSGISTRQSNHQYAGGRFGSACMPIPLRDKRLGRGR